MTTQREPFPDVEDAVCDLIEDLVAKADMVKPAELAEEELPFAFVYRFAGADDGVTDRPVLGIDVFDNTRGRGLPTALAIQQRLLAAPHVVSNDDAVIVIDAVSTSEGPHEVPYGDSSIRRWASSYSLALRR